MGSQGGIPSLRQVAGGNIYWVKKASDPDYGLFIQTHQQTYMDGTNAVYTTVQAAVNAIAQVTGDTASLPRDRGDIIYVCSPASKVANPASPGNYYNQKINEEVYVTVPGLKIFALSNNWECQWRASDGATKYPITPTGGTATSGLCLYLLARSIEVAGFLFDGGGAYGGVYVGDGYNVAAINALGYTNQNSAGCYIHDCYFQGGNEGNYGIILDGCSADVLIENNIFNQWKYAGIYMIPGGSRTVQRPVIRRNTFWASSTGNYGVDMYSHATTVGVSLEDNTFRDGASATFAAPWRFQGAGVHTMTGNKLACANAWSAAATDWSSGNYKFNIAGSVTTTVSQA